MHTGLFYCCKCCDGYGAVHCCGECCANTELGFGVNHTVACKHPCVKGAQRHDMTPVKKMHIKGNRQVDDDVLELPSSGVGRWNCCGAGCKVRHCRHSESPPHGHPHSVPHHHHHAPPPQGRSPSSRSPNVSPAPSSASRSAARHYPLYADPSLHPTYPAYAGGGGGSGGSTAGYSPPRGSGLGGGDSVMDTSASTVASSMAAAAAAAAASGGERGERGGTGPSSYAISPTSSSRCDECGVEEATAWCSNCEALFCPADFLAAHASKVGQRHTAIEINYAPSRCVEHPDVRAIFHCVDCAVDVCRLCCCRVTNPDGHHTHHRVVTLGDAERSSFAELKRRVDATKALKQDLDLRLRAASQRRKKAEEAGEDGRRRVGEVFSAVTAGVFRCLEKRRKEVLDELDAVGAPVVAALTEEEASLGAASRGCGEAVATSVAVLLSNRSLKIVDSLSRTHDAADAAAEDARGGGEAATAAAAAQPAAVLPVVRLPETEAVLAELAPLIAGLGAVSSEAFAASPPPSPVPAAAKVAAAAAAEPAAATTTPMHRPVRAAPSPAAKTPVVPAAATPSPPPAQAQAHDGTTAAAAAAKASPAPVLPAATPSPQPRAAAAEAAAATPSPSQQQQKAAALSSLEREAIETEATDAPASPASSPPPPVEDEEEGTPEEEVAVVVGGDTGEPAAVSPEAPVEAEADAAVVTTTATEEEEDANVGAASEEDGGDAVFWCEGCEAESEGAMCDVCVTECVVKPRRSL